MAADLITLKELKDALGAGPEPDTEKDAKLNKAISAASTAIRKFADRSFGEAIDVSTRSYAFDDSGYLDIDDANKINTVAFVLRQFTFNLEEVYWRAEPQDGPPFNYLIIPRWTGVYSPEMGFKRNLDVVSKERGWPGMEPTVSINADWGWPEVPEDVRQAAILTAAKFAEKPDKLISESIAGYSYTSAIRGTTVISAVPGEAQDLLAAYIRPNV